MACSESSSAVRMGSTPRSGTSRRARTAMWVCGASSASTVRKYGAPDSRGVASLTVPSRYWSTVRKARTEWATSSRTFLSPRPGWSHWSPSTTRTALRNHFAAYPNAGTASALVKVRSATGPDLEAAISKRAEGVVGVHAFVHVTSLLGPHERVSAGDAVEDLQDPSFV